MIRKPTLFPISNNFSSKSPMELTLFKLYRTTSENSNANEPKYISFGAFGNGFSSRCVCVFFDEEKLVDAIDSVDVVVVVVPPLQRRERKMTIE
eukprot:m.121741 g.121741  ORF g.121741 m.121741 type:complete len:94 (-) comp12928_c1_seq2:3262-3543(-)